MRFDEPSRAVARAGSHGTAAMCGAMRMTVPSTTVASTTVASTTVASTTVASTTVPAMTVPWLASPWHEQQGRSVPAGIGSLVRKAEARPRAAATNAGYVVHIDDVWGPDPWRPHPV